MQLVDYVFLHHVLTEFSDANNFTSQIHDLIQNATNSEAGVEIKDRRRKLVRVYKKCFVASEFITWICTHFNTTRYVGARICTFLQNQGHITCAHHKQIPIMDADILYRFTSESVSTPRGIPKPPPLMLSGGQGTVRLEPMSKPIKRRRTENEQIDHIIGSLLAKTPIYFGTDNSFKQDEVHEAEPKAKEMFLHIKSISIHTDKKDPGRRSFAKKKPSPKYYYKLVVDDHVHTSEVSESTRWNDSFKIPVKSVPTTVYMIFFEYEKAIGEDVIGFKKVKLCGVGGYNLDKLELQIQNVQVSSTISAVMSCEY